MRKWLVDNWIKIFGCIGLIIVAVCVFAPLAVGAFRVFWWMALAPIPS